MRENKEKLNNEGLKSKPESLMSQNVKINQSSQNCKTNICLNLQEMTVI